LADVLVDDVNGSYHVIIQPVAMDRINCESQIATLTLRLRDQGSQQDENKANRYNEHLYDGHVKTKTASKYHIPGRS